MAFTKEITRLEKSNVKLTLTVPKEEIRSQYQKMMGEYTKNLQIPGFRKGKVPQEVLERKYSEALKGDALGRIIESTLHEVFEDKDLPRSERPLPYSTPELQDEPKFDIEQDLQFSVVYDVLPEVKIGQWKGLKAEYTYAEITNEEINKELEAVRERNAIVMDRDDSASAQKGDVATINYEVIDENGESIEAYQRKDFVLTLGANNNIYQLDDEVIGMKKGETKEFDKKFNDDFLENALAGQTKKMRITLSQLKEKKPPSLDDDLAQDVDEKFKTLDDLKNSIKEKLNKKLDFHLREKKINELMKQIMENTPVTLPESMLRADIEGRMQRMARYYNASAEVIMQMMGTGEEGKKRMEEWRAASQTALHSRLIIETLMEEQKIEVSDDDVNKEFEQIASDTGADIEDIKKNYDEQAMLYLKEDIREKRFIDLLFAENTLKPGKKVKYLDLIKENQ